ncbi:hypothetical protein [Myroides odoratimimus]|uniref:hypothetical protein n=1 Tax=Myroides odoratimimus TaxID=76832 RepID=UPI000686356C|nr:hypothetical protein [Myroides odoratimimus]
MIFNQFFIALIWGFDRGREPLNVEEVIDIDDNVEELISEEEDSHMSEGVMSIKKNIGSRIYGDFNGDGKRGYV